VDQSAEQHDPITVIEHAAIVTAAEFISITGWWVTDRERELRVTATPVTTSRPTTLEGTVKVSRLGHDTLCRALI
jgi:exodeoxyribonuclease V alpha subunit